MHLSSYNLTCYKYNTHKSRAYRFYFPQPLLAKLEIDRNCIIPLKQDNVWVKLWSIIIDSLIWSNHDINFILLKIKVLILIHYITNYTIKGNCNQYYIVIAPMIIRTVFDNYDKDSIISLINYILSLIKFYLNILNWLFYY